MTKKHPLQRLIEKLGYKTLSLRSLDPGWYGEEDEVLCVRIHPGDSIEADIVQAVMKLPASYTAKDKKAIVKGLRSYEDASIIVHMPGGGMGKGYASYNDVPYVGR